MFPSKATNTNLWLYIQQSNFSLIVDLLDGFKFGTKHKSLETAVLQELIPRDALGHGFIRDEIIFLSILLILTLGSGGVCVEAIVKFSPRTFLQLALLKEKVKCVVILTWCRVGKCLWVLGQ